MREVDPATLFGIPLPRHICGFARGEITNNEITNPGYGFTIPYDGPNGKATIYLYDLGATDIPDSPTSDVVIDHFHRVLRDVEQLKEHGLYQYVELVTEYLTAPPESGLGFLCGEFVIQQSGRQFDTFAFVTCFAHRFVKVRITLPKSDQSWATARAFADTYACTLWPHHRAAFAHESPS